MVKSSQGCEVTLVATLEYPPQSVLPGARLVEECEDARLMVALKGVGEGAGCRVWSLAPEVEGGPLCNGFETPASNLRQGLRKIIDKKDKKIMLDLTETWQKRFSEQEQETVLQPLLSDVTTPAGGILAAHILQCGRINQEGGGQHQSQLEVGAGGDTRQGVYLEQPHPEEQGQERENTLEQELEHGDREGMREEELGLEGVDQVESPEGGWGDTEERWPAGLTCAQYLEQVRVLLRSGHEGLSAVLAAVQSCVRPGPRTNWIKFSGATMQYLVPRKRDSPAQFWRGVQRQRMKMIVEMDRDPPRYWPLAAGALAEYAQMKVVCLKNTVRGGYNLYDLQVGMTAVRLLHLTSSPTPILLLEVSQVMSKLETSRVVVRGSKAGVFSVISTCLQQLKALATVEVAKVLCQAALLGRVLVSSKQDLWDLLCTLALAVEEQSDREGEVDARKIQRPLVFQKLGEKVWEDPEPQSHRAHHPVFLSHQRENLDNVRQIVKDVLEPQIEDLRSFQLSAVKGGTLDFRTEYFTVEEPDKGGYRKIRLIHREEGPENLKSVPVRKTRRFRGRRGGGPDDQDRMEDLQKPVLLVVQPCHLSCHNNRSSQCKSHPDCIISVSADFTMTGLDSKLIRMWNQRTGAYCYCCRATKEAAHSVERVREGFYCDMSMSQLLDIVEDLLLERGVPREEWENYELTSVPGDEGTRFGIKRYPLSTVIDSVNMYAVLHTGQLRAFCFLCELIIR